MKWLLTLAAALAAVSGAPGVLHAGSGAELTEAVRTIELDPQECYRVRDARLARDELRVYLTDGWLIFAKPVAGRTLAAVFVREPEGGDAEMMLMPPTKGERVSLARFTGTPNLNEHLDVAVLLFTDNTAEELRRYTDPSRRSAENGLLLQSRYAATVQNLAASFLVRLTEQLLAQTPPPEGFLYAAVTGRTLDNFDMVYDPMAREQIYLGRLVNKENRLYYDTWTSFRSRSFREGQRGPRPDPFRIEEYRIEAVLDPSLELRVRTAAAIVPSRPLRVLAFDLSGRMRLSGVRVNGEESEFLSPESLRSNLLRGQDGAQFLVVPSEPLEPGRSYEIEFEHAGNVIATADHKVYYVGSRGSWYPRAGAAFSRYDMTFTYPERLNLVFPGAIQHERTEGGQTTTRRLTTGPIRLAGFNLGEYEVEKVSRGGLEVEVYANRTAEPNLRRRPADVVVWPQPGPFGRGGRRPEIVALPPPAPPDPTARLDPLAEQIASCFEFFAQRFGPPAQPLLMVSPIPGSFGQGFPGLVYLSTLTYLKPEERPGPVRTSEQQLFFSEILHAHETAHQWWGNIVTSAGPADDWLMETLANYSALLVLEKKNGPRALAAVLEQYKQHLLEKGESGETRESTGPIRLGLRLDNSLAPGAWRTILYEKGTWIVHMLRRRMGDQAFLAAVGELARRYRHQPVSTEQFREVAAAHLPKGTRDRDLEGFVESWVNSTGIPELTLTTSLQGKAPAMKLNLALSQSGVEEGFSVLAPVEIQLSRTQKRVLWLETGSEPATETIALRSAPLRVRLDPDGAVLRR